MTLQAIASISWISNLLTAAEQQSMTRKTLRALAGIAVHELDAGFGLKVTTLFKQDIPTMIRPALLKMPAVYIKSKITGGPGAGLGYAGLLVLVSSG
ncbi:hypothetical protein [Thalassolituus hydrocarboniclasticus]|uniref:Uncharacterized protein n=1 Tax=Thalassolituus hydrocarboniclasticus TaxID=2742796 RepID=A0ABY6AG89_9GAMM|nr:hypothetical protein [Thalassolituus hydrocarboniclasticus]UXD88899.1 hypothetical protein HUF19_16270 [Thalassolituus hydrocarboniclasticus]